MDVGDVDNRIDRIFFFFAGRLWIRLGRTSCSGPFTAVNRILSPQIGTGVIVLMIAFAWIFFNIGQVIDSI